MLVGEESSAIMSLLFKMVIYSCATCSKPCNSAATLGAHMTSHQREAQNASTAALATPSKPGFDDHGRALWWKAHNAVCDACEFGGTVINCSYVTLCGIKLVQALWLSRLAISCVQNVSWLK